MFVVFIFSVIRAKTAWKGFAFIIVLRLWRVLRVIVSKYWVLIFIKLGL